MTADVLNPPEWVTTVTNIAIGLVIFIVIVALTCGLVSLAGIALVALVEWMFPLVPRRRRRYIRLPGGWSIGDPPLLTSADVIAIEARNAEPRALAGGGDVWAADKLARTSTPWRRIMNSDSRPTPLTLADVRSTRCMAICRECSAPDFTGYVMALGFETVAPRDSWVKMHIDDTGHTVAMTDGGWLSPEDVRRYMRAVDWAAVDIRAGQFLLDWKPEDEVWR